MRSALPKVVALALFATICVPQSALASRPSPKQLISRVKAVTREVRVESHLTGDDVAKQLALNCDDARLKRHEPEAKAEADALFAEAAKLVEESIGHDFAPAFKGAHSDYAVLAGQIQAEAASTAAGVKHHALVQAALKLRRAQVSRNQEVSYVRKEIAAMRPAAYGCEVFDLQQAAFGEQRLAEATEEDVLKTLQFALKQKATRIHAIRPLSFKVHVTLTVTETTTMLLGTPQFCGETGAAGGTATETADFPAFVVTPTGAVRPTESTATASVSGSWTASGTYAPENQCEHLTSFACNGGYAPTLAGSPFSSLAITAEKSSLARAQVDLPEIQESGEESCPDGGQQQAFIPLPLIAHQLAAHADSFAFAVDGSALRGRFEPLTVENGIEHLGPPLPGSDCTQTFPPSTACGTQGSRLHVVVRIEPVET
jgi:hypothetical protein